MVVELRVRLRTLIVVGTIALAMLVTGTAIGATLQKNGGPVTAVRTATADDQVSTTSTTYTDVPGMSATLKIPSGERALLIVNFSAMTHCSAGSTGFCHVRVVVDGNPAQPSQVVFDSTEDGGTGTVNSWESNSMQFVAGPKLAGTHTVKVQYWVSGGPSPFRFASRTLTVLRSRVA